MTKNQADLLYLLACALDGISPQSRYVRKMDIAAVAHEAARHSVSALCCAALESSGVYDAGNSAAAKSDGEEVHDDKAAEPLALLRERRNKAIRKVILLDAEREAILRELDREHIWYVPLKGINYKHLYPGIGMREMSDNDILIDPCGRKKIHDIMVDREYEVKLYDVNNHDVYEKKPIYNFEMHTGLFRMAVDEQFGSYFSDISERLMWEDTSPQRSCYARRMTDSDEYGYLIAHAYKHYSSGGTGIRTLCDVFVINRARGGVPNDETENLLHSLGLDDFEAMLRKTADAIFSEPVSPDELNAELSADVHELVDYCFSSGTHGFSVNRIKNEIIRNSQDSSLSLGSRLAYIRSRVFPPISWYRQNYSFLDRHPCLIPLFALYRLTVRAFAGRKRLRREMKVIHKLGKDNHSESER